VRETTLVGSDAEVQLPKPRGRRDERRGPGRRRTTGHNPSEHAWTLGHYYSNPSNRMWKLLRLGRIIPQEYAAEDNNRLAAELGLGAWVGWG
jgi:hypothetical protein